MGDLTKNLSRSEFACPCGKCGIAVADFELVNVLQECVDDFQFDYPHMEVAINLNSANRCPAYNATIPGASPDSQHTKYIAVDFYLYDKVFNDRISDDEVADYFDKKYPDKYGIGRYKGRTHFDVQFGMKRRWDNR